MAKRKPKDHNGRQRNENAKVQDLAAFRENPEEQHLTTDQGLRINDDQNSLKAGERGGSLLDEDESAGIWSRHDDLRDHSDEEAKNNPHENCHVVLPAMTR